MGVLRVLVSAEVKEAPLPTNGLRYCHGKKQVGNTVRVAHFWEIGEPARGRSDFFPLCLSLSLWLILSPPSLLHTQVVGKGCWIWWMLSSPPKGSKIWSLSLCWTSQRWEFYLLPLSSFSETLNRTVLFLTPPTHPTCIWACVCWSFGAGGCFSVYLTRCGMPVVISAFVDDAFVGDMAGKSPSKGFGGS